MIFVCNRGRFDEVVLAIIGADPLFDILRCVIQSYC